MKLIENLTRDNISRETSYERLDMISCKRSHFSQEMSREMISQERDMISIEI